MMFGVCESKLSIFCDIFTKSANADKVLLVAVFGTLSMYKSSKYDFVTAQSSAATWEHKNANFANILFCLISSAKNASNEPRMNVVLQKLVLVVIIEIYKFQQKSELYSHKIAILASVVRSFCKIKSEKERK